MYIYLLCFTKCMLLSTVHRSSLMYCKKYYSYHCYYLLLFVLECFNTVIKMLVMNGLNCIRDWTPTSVEGHCAEGLDQWTHDSHLGRIKEASAPRPHTHTPGWLAVKVVFK